MCLPLKPYRIEREWEHQGLQCAVVQARPGMHRCGYVRVPPSHPYFKKHYDHVPVEVHGGLTFSHIEDCQHEDGTGWWFGFDCAHAGDAMVDPLATDFDEFGKVYKQFQRLEDEHYWTQEEVERETERLAGQLNELPRV